MKYRKALWLIHKAGYDFVILKDVMDIMASLEEDDKNNWCAQWIADFVIDVIREM